MNQDRLLSLAAGTVLDVGPAETVTVAARAGFAAAGIWYDPESWTAQTTRAVAGELRATGLTALDMEPVILGRPSDPGDALIDVAAELGVRHVLVASGPASRSAVVERFGALCDRAAPGGVTLVLEFLPIFTIATLADAVGVVLEANRPNGGVLVDTLHLARSGGSPADLRTIRPTLLPYLQIADAPARPPDPAHLRDEALHGRLLPGEGDLPLAETLAEVPSVPLSFELRSSALMEAFPDPTERAGAVLDAAQRLVSAGRGG